jgi:hypothetical protein
MSEDPSNAIKEVAKTTGKAIDAASGMGRFFERIFGPALQEYGSALEDKVRVWRQIRLLRRKSQYEKECALIDKDHESHAVEPKFALALLEAASLEDDDDLQDMFARLLVNATISGTGVEDRKTYVSILSEMTPLDAKVLKTISAAQPSDFGGRPDDFAINTERLPDGYSSYYESSNDLPPSPTKEVRISLRNLVRLGCIESARLGGPSTIAFVLITELGRALMEACTPLGDRST